MSVAQFLKKNIVLAPLLACVVGGCAMAGGYIARVNMKGHYLSWSSDNTYPWQNIQPTQNTKLLGLQGEEMFGYKEKDVFKPRDSNDLRGRL